ncbi:unnamed protein product [Calicophoron daubneyi]|uniref:Serpin domain-containing protein n=1 Tax=Calicophoron daubneyi TaxID=300641 RepID=A0AAV2U1G0_CALDB
MNTDQELIRSCLSTFTSDLYAQLIKHQHEVSNLFVSPTSIWIAMSMTEAGSRGETRKEMIHTLRLPSQMEDEEMHELVGRTMMSCFESVEGVDVSLANRLFILRAAHIEERFQKLLQKCYKSDSEQLDSGSVDAKRDRMNIWVSEMTKGKIKHLLPPGSIDQETLITIINTIYFRNILSGWREVFAKEMTSDAPFHKLDGSEQTVKMMWIEEIYPYVRLPDIGAQALRIPFRHRDWEMLVVLPDKQDGLPNLLSHLQKPGGIDTILKAQFTAEDVILNLPRFKLGEGPAVDVKKILSLLGMRLVFDEQNADLSGICKSEHLVVSKVLHKAILEVDEEGATAAAATAVVLKKKCGRMRIESITFRVDHPFFVSIVYGGTIPVFLGHVTSPENF